MGKINANILTAIKENRCILFLGPLMSSFSENNQNISHTELFCKELSKELDINHILFDEKAKNNPYHLTAKYLSNGKKIADLEKSITEIIYKKESHLYYDLALLPFNTIVNFGFDYLMKDALNKRGFEFEFRYYNYQGPEIQHLEVDNNIQLCYNIYGVKHRPVSRIHTEGDLLKFLRCINSGPKLPDDLLTRIKQNDEDSKAYIFLGFDFEDWTFRFLLDTLEIPKTDLSITTQTQGTNIALMTSDFYKDRFGLTFLEEPLIDFVKDLINAYKPAEHKFGYISYHENDEHFRDNISLFVDNSKLVQTRGISFWDKSKLLAHEIANEEKKKRIDEATIYIPLISINFLNDPELKKELKEAINRDDVLVFPIILKNCPWTNSFRDLEKKAKVILPGKNKVLKTSDKDPGDDDYQRIVNIINSKIR